MRERSKAEKKFLAIVGCIVLVIAVFVYWPRKLEIPYEANRVVIGASEEAVELNEEEMEVLFEQFEEAKIGTGRFFIPRSWGGGYIYFYKDNELLDEFFVRDWKYVVTSDSNLIQYPIKAVPLELYGETLWADNYPHFSVFVGKLQEKARIRVCGTEITEMISDEATLSDLKELISDVYHFGNFQIENEIYRFSLNENGIASLELEEVKGTIESGDLYVTITDGTFKNAKLEVSYRGDDYNLYEYVTEW